MSVVVYEFAHSPFCIPITAALRSCGVDFETREVSNADRTEILRLTAGDYYQVPVLLDGTRIVYETGGDTQEIARYIDEHFAKGALFPPALEGIQAILIDHLENEVEGVTFKLVDPHYLASVSDVLTRGMIIRHKERKFGRGCVEQWRRQALDLRTEADRLLGRFETTLRHSPYILGEQPVYADFLLYGILGNMTYKGWNVLDPDRQAALIAWQQRLSEYRFSR